jgi:hypothetical protein
MFIIHGKRGLRIKSYTDSSQQCSNCKSFDLRVAIYRRYFHVFFIPFFPIGIKSSALWCHDCGQQFRMDSLQTQYEKNTKTPFYLYTGPILIGLLILLLVNESIKSGKKNKEFVQNPKTGDVYLIRDDSGKTTSYYFLKVASIHGDTLSVFHNKYEYSRFISRLQDDDFFEAGEELLYTKKEMLQMLDKGEINSVERDYDDDKGFERVK